MKAAIMLWSALQSAARRGGMMTWHMRENCVNVILRLFLYEQSWSETNMCKYSVEGTW